MGHKNGKWADIPTTQVNPLKYAVAARDGSVIDMVDQAVRHKQVALAYQAVIPAVGGPRAAFYEGLIRVLDEVGRIIPAKDFIDTIETTETGRIIDCLALEKGLRALNSHPNLRLSINMSARSIGYTRWNRILNRGLSADPTVAERLILEISEMSTMLVPEIVVNFMGVFRRKGISFALDDFGAGLTSLRHLRDCYFDIIKIDGQFIRGITENPDNQVLTAAFVAIAEQFDLVTVAENVETEGEAVYLAELGIDCLQGYYFGAPTIHPSWSSKNDERSRA